MSNIIKFSDLAKDLEIKQKVDSYNQLINVNPPKSWIRVQAGVKHIPIDRTKMNLRIIYGTFGWKINDYKVIANSVTVSGTLTVKHPVTGETMELDGIGAMPLEMEKGALATDFTKVRSKAVHKNLPAANSFALKNAASQLGRLFGEGLNSEDVEFTPTYSKPEMTDEQKNTLRRVTTE